MIKGVDKKIMAKTTESTFYCTRCGKRGIPIQRKKGAEREGGHLKKLYCVFCKDEVNHVECKSSYTHENFLFEYNNGNFDETGKRIMTYGQLKVKVMADENKRKDN